MFLKQIKFLSLLKSLNLKAIQLDETSNTCTCVCMHAYMYVCVLYIYAHTHL